MIDAKRLLSDLTHQLKKLEDDLRQRIGELPELRETLQREWQSARDANRCAETFESWSEQLITQAGVHWLLSCVFLRFIEDNELVERPWLSGTAGSGRLTLARDRAEAWFRARPLDTDRDYLLAAFHEVATLPGLKTFFDAAHNPVFRIHISADAAMGLRSFWQQIDPDSGALKHDFTDADWNTRFLGDLYQDLSEATRKRYALLQTPEFVEEFILDRTLTPAIQQFGFREVRLIDPTCGSGHFLLGAFARLVALWFQHEPGRNPVDIAQKGLDAVAGVDLNPFAVAITRFRLWIAALRTAGVQRLIHAPNFKLNVAIGDSLLHGPRFGLTVSDDLFASGDSFAGTGLAHAYASEDLDEVQRILGQQYHAVVGNPPYIVVKDAALNQKYRQRFPQSCHRQYSLGCPFTERFFDLAIGGSSSSLDAAGFVGLITANSFMKREFGSKLIEKVLPQLDLTHVIDTAGAYIPGHGTPTVILFGRHRRPMDDGVRTVMGIKGEPSTPEDPAQGLVWSAIVAQIDQPGSQSDFVSATDSKREQFGKHPWSIGGGGASDLKELIESEFSSLAEIGADLGYQVITGEDNCFLMLPADAKRLAFDEHRAIGEGDVVRDWACQSHLQVLWPYELEGTDLPAAEVQRHISGLWVFRSTLKGRKAFGVPVEDKGLRWWDLREVYKTRLCAPLTITFAEVATHNHFVLDRGGKVFKQTAPIIKLPAGSSTEVHLGLLGLLNSSVACFWMKQVCFPKGGDHVGTEGARVRKTLWDERYAFNSTNLAEFPLVEVRPLAFARHLDKLASELADCLPASLLAAADLPNRARLDAARTEAQRLREQMIAWQEELDWHCYALYALLPADASPESLAHPAPPDVRLGERAFEIVLARQMAAGGEQSTWFERHGSMPITALPAHWPADYRAVVERRIALIESDRNIGLIERPEYKRRWNDTPWAELEQAALRDWLLDRLESPRYWPRKPEAPQLSTSWRLSEAARSDANFLVIAALYTGRADIDLAAMIAELVASESVPFLPAQRYSESGARKREQWLATWSLQRREDAGEDVGKIPVPPKYKSTDFSKPGYWKLRGALDVPKERWINYPACERGADASLPIVWAGWNHLQQAQAVAAYYMEMKDVEGWPAARLLPLLAGLQELVPWLQQWHNQVDPHFGERMGDFYAGFLADEARALGFTLGDLSAWQPAARARRSRS
ncbi:MAG: BREX-2 system adenine-specific DNA-methyltransferase PglX [Xanthomonadales bacterium]|nr:BREX-2 system adenine-specific DNA-methyltransferase PglX [Xanthomonadales bacterium]